MSSDVHARKSFVMPNLSFVFLPGLLSAPFLIGVASSSSSSNAGCCFPSPPYFLFWWHLKKHTQPTSGCQVSMTEDPAGRFICACFAWRASLLTVLFWVFPPLFRFRWFSQPTGGCTGRLNILFFIAQSWISPYGWHCPFLTNSLLVVWSHFAYQMLKMVQISSGSNSLSSLTDLGLDTVLSEPSQLHLPRKVTVVRRGREGNFNPLWDSLR